MSENKPLFADVVGALVLREMVTRFGRRQLGYVWGLIEPGMYVLIAMTLFYLTGRRVVTEWPLPLFILTGICPWLLFYRTDNFIRASIHVNIGLLAHSAITPFHIMVSRWLLEGATVLTFAVVAFVGYRIGWNEPRAIPTYASPVVTAIVLDLLFAFGVGSCLASLTVRFPGLAFSLGYGVRALFLTAGIWYVPDYAPAVYRPVIFWNPLTHIIALFRQGFSATYPAHGANPLYPLLVALVLIFIGLLMERFCTRRWVAS